MGSVYCRLHLYASTQEIPEDLKTGLKEYEAIKNEIDQFVKIISPKKETYACVLS